LAGQRLIPERGLKLRSPSIKATVKTAGRTEVNSRKGFETIKLNVAVNRHREAGQRLIPERGLKPVLASSYNPGYVKPDRG